MEPLDRTTAHLLALLQCPLLEHAQATVVAMQSEDAMVPLFMCGEFCEFAADATWAKGSIVCECTKFIQAVSAVGRWTSGGKTISLNASGVLII